MKRFRTRARVCVLALMAVASSLSAHQRPSSAQAGLSPIVDAEFVAYRMPVQAVVVDGFRPPSHFAGPGNRGLEFGTAGGEVVRAAAAGRVLFAGQVGGSQFVTILHDDGLRTSYGHLDLVQVQVGDLVAAGADLAHAQTGFHFGVRIGDTYLDPAVLLLPVASASTSARLVPITLGSP